VCQRQHADDSRFERVVSQEHRTGLSDSQFRARETGRSIGNAGRTSSLTDNDAFAAEERKYCSPPWMLAKVGRDNKFTGTECRVSRNQCRGFCQASYLVRFTTSRGESLLKACEKISVGWSVQNYSSFEIVIVKPVLYLPVPVTALLNDLAHQRASFFFPNQSCELFLALADVFQFG